MDIRCKCDLHSHSDCSHDGHSSVEDMCKTAMDRGIYYYAVTDHCECNEYDDMRKRKNITYRSAVRLAWDRMTECKEKFPELCFLRGIELGQPMQNLEAAEDALSGRDYDIVIGSVHNTKDNPDFIFMNPDLPEETVKSHYDEYFKEILDMINWGRFDTLAHITYPLRYLCPPGVKADFENHQEELREVLKALIREGKALEFNTSRIGRTDCPELPDFKIFSLYKELGGKLITLGSDAHITDNVGNGIKEALELLYCVGYREVTVFKDRKPMMIPIE